MPFVIKTHNIKRQIDPDQAIAYVAKQIRMFQYLRDPSDIDVMVYHGWHVLMDAMYIYSDIHDFYEYICPENAVENDQGYSYYEAKKFEGKSQALIDFFKVEKPDF